MGFSHRAQLFISLLLRWCTTLLKLAVVMIIRDTASWQLTNSKRNDREAAPTWLPETVTVGHLSLTCVGNPV